jgi:zinc protease
MRLSLALLTALLLPLLSAATVLPADDRPAADERLPVDPALVTGALPNGLRYIVRPHRNPEGRVSIWLHVGTGSLNETETTRGIAHYLEHMAFNGSANFPPGSVVPFFQSLGLAFGRDQNAFTGFDQTAFQLALPGNGRDLLEKGMLFMSDVAFRQSLSADEIDAERQIILEEKRARSSARQRVQDEVYAQLAPESTIGRRLPIGTEETIKSVARPDFVDYYTRWYVPANMTVIVVGDVDPALAVEMITRAFGSAPALPRPPPRDVGVKRTGVSRAVVVTDPELTRAAVSIMRIEPPLPPVTTVAQKRRELVDSIGTWTFTRRMNAEIAAGRVSFLEADASVRDWTGVMRSVSVGAEGRPGTWKTMLADLGTALQRARLYGFTEREVEDARAALIAHAEEAVQREATRPARDVLRQINSAVAREEPPMSASAALALAKRLLPGITAAEVSQAFALTFDLNQALVVAELPSGDAVPSDAELVALGRTALDVKPDKPVEAARPTALLTSLPAGGSVVDTATHAASGVTSMWLDNGVRVHHRFMDQRRNEASVTITLAGGAIEETAANRGITEAALRAWERPATHTLSSTAIRDLMTGAKVRTRAGITGDALSLTVAGDPAELERGMQLAYLLLTDPYIEPAALEQWKDGEQQRIAAWKNQPMQALVAASARSMYPPTEIRPKSLTAEQVQALTRDAAQAWLTRLIERAPMEVAVVGDIDRAEATRLVARYLGGLPARPRISDKTLADLRTIARANGPLRVEETIAARTPQAAVFVGFYGVDLTNTRDTRLLNVAARILTTRMTKSIREDKQLVYSIGASSEPATVYPGFGIFASVAPTDPGKATTLAAAVEDTYAAFAKDGPTADEMAVARKQLVTLLDEVLKTPDFWLGRLGTMEYRGLHLDELLGARAQYERFAAPEVQEAFARYDRPEARLRFIITPN